VLYRIPVHEPAEADDDDKYDAEKEAFHMRHTHMVSRIENAMR
jgi:hypothetical protein